MKNLDYERGYTRGKKEITYVLREVMRRVVAIDREITRLDRAFKEEEYSKIEKPLGKIKKILKTSI